MTQIYSNTVVVLVLLFMAVQDFRYRGISWYHFLTLGIFLYLSKGGVEIGEVLINLVFLCIVFALLTVWFSFKERRLLNLLEHHIGLGDLLFLTCIALYLPFSSFFLFYLLSTLIILVGVGLYVTSRKPKDFTVPLAGLQALLLLVAMTLSWCHGKELYEFELIYQYLL